MDKPTLPVTLQSIDITALGRWESAAQTLIKLEEAIKTTIPLDPEQSSYPEIFTEFVRYNLQNNPTAKVLVLPEGLRLSGDIELDWAAGWVRREGVVGVVCEGDLLVEGDIANRNLDGGPLLCVLGNLQVNNLVKGGAPVVILGQLRATGVVIGEYNHGVIRVNGDLTAAYLICLDHDCWVQGTTHAVVLDADEQDLTEVLVSEVFESDAEAEPSTERLWAWQRAGLPILKPDADIE